MLEFIGDAAPVRGAIGLGAGDRDRVQAGARGLVAEWIQKAKLALGKAFDRLGDFGQALHARRQIYRFGCAHALRQVLDRDRAGDCDEPARQGVLPRLEARAQSVGPAEGIRVDRCVERVGLGEQVAQLRGALERLGRAVDEWQARAGGIQRFGAVRLQELVVQLKQRFLVG